MVLLAALKLNLSHIDRFGFRLQSWPPDCAPWLTPMNQLAPCDERRVRVIVSCSIHPCSTRFYHHHPSLCSLSTIDLSELSPGLVLEERTVPIGVLLIIFESRPDALPQVSACHTAVPATIGNPRTRFATPHPIRFCRLPSGRAMEFCSRAERRLRGPTASFLTP